MLAYQNCSDVSLINSESTSEITCLPPRYKIDSDDPTESSTRFLVTDERDSAISKVFDWSVEGIAVSHSGSDFSFPTEDLEPCRAYRVKARYKACSKDQEISFDYRHIPSGQACAPQPPQEDPPIIPAGCPNTITTPTGTTRTLRTSADINWGIYGVFHHNQSVTEWNNIWGRFTRTSGAIPPPLTWPGMSGNNPSIKVRRGEYLGIHFKTAATGFRGEFKNPSFNVSGNIIFSISRACGDFTDHLPNRACLANGGEFGGFGEWTGIPSSDHNLVNWSMSPTAPGCRLEPNTDYYINVMFVDTTLDPRSDRCPNQNDLCYFSSVSYSQALP